MSPVNAYLHGQEEAFAFYKIAGGPGSGVAGKNTKPIDMPHSPYTSVGSRKGILENMHWVKRMIPLKDIKCVGQHKYVPKKLAAMVKKPEIVKENPIDVLQVGEHEYHVVDGHHRYLAALKLGLKEIPARIRKKAAKTLEKAAEEGAGYGLHHYDQLDHVEDWMNFEDYLAKKNKNLAKRLVTVDPLEAGVSHLNRNDRAKLTKSYQAWHKSHKPNQTSRPAVMEKFLDNVQNYDHR